MISWSVCKRVNQACHGADITGKSRSLMGNGSDVQCRHVVRPRDVTALTGVLAVVDGGALTQIAPDRGRCRREKGLLTQIAPDRNRTVGGGGGILYVREAAYCKSVCKSTACHL